MFRFDHILEHWAELYEPLVQAQEKAPKFRVFFRVGMIDEQSYFVRNYNSLPSPCMSYASHLDAEVAKQNSKANNYRHVTYFFEKQGAGTLNKTTATDEDGAAEARFLPLTVLWMRSRI